MKLDARAFGIAAGIVAAAVSAVCALVVAIAPGSATGLLSYVIHADLTGLARTVTWGSFTGGMLFWGLATGLVFALGGWLYNRLVRGGAASPESLQMAEQRG